MGAGVMTQVSRRGLMGIAGAAAVLPVAAHAQAMPGLPGLPRFGPAPDIAHLLYNENPYGPPPSAIRAMAERAAQGCYYVDDIDPKLAALIAERLGVGVDNIVMGNGSSEVLWAAASAWGRKGAILTPELIFDEPLVYAKTLDIPVRIVPMAPDLGIDLVALQAGITADTALIYVCNPNNPTGLLLDPVALRRFIVAVAPKATVMVDEAYVELTDDPTRNTAIDMVRAGHDVIVTRTVSKVYGMAGLRVGYAVTTPANARRIKAHRMTIGVASAGMAAALAAVNDAEFLRASRGAIAQGRSMIMAAVQAAGLRALSSQTNFVFVEVPDADALQKAMAARGIVIRGSYPGWPRWSRVSTGKIEHVRRYADALPVLTRS